MGKNLDTLSIKDVAAQFGLTPQSLRNYERLGLIPPARRDDRGWRFYTSEDVTKLRAFYNHLFDNRKRRQPREQR